MDKDLFKHRRKSYIALGEIYFWTATIHHWIPILSKDSYKDIIINSLEYLSDKGKIDVFAFVVMPNHVHFIWRINEKNGKEAAHSSFLKFTAHEFRKALLKDDSATIDKFRVKANNKEHEFWQRDSLAIPLYTKKVAIQKLEYVHANPLAGHWNLASDPCEYWYSSARYYDLGIKDFSFLRDLMVEF